ncbi:glycosyltransferase family A protein, partial [Nostoc sp. NIES-2111]
MASVDIAVPCYQYGRFLEACVSSILSQGIEAVRILIVDNASTDGSAETARALSRSDDRIEVLCRERNTGPHASFNAGVDWATADYFMVLCADDLLAPGALRSAVDVLERRPKAAFAYGEDVHWREGTSLPRTDEDGKADWRIEPGRDFITQRCRPPERYIAAGMVLVRTAAQKAA